MGRTRFLSISQVLHAVNQLANLKKNQIVENNMNLNFLLFINEHTTERKPHMSKTKILIETEKDEYQNTAKAKLNLLPGW